MATEFFNKSMARNIYYGGSFFCFLLLLGLTFETTREMPERANTAALTESVAKGKDVWEKNNCVGCHTIMGEGAYFAPELANAYDRLGGSNEQTFKTFLKSWMAIQPLAVPGRRKMPQFNLTDDEVNNLADFLIWTSKIDDNNWPPNKQG